jgi:hypothetical protein
MDVSIFISVVYKFFKKNLRIMQNSYPEKPKWEHYIKEVLLLFQYSGMLRI